MTMEIKLKASDGDFGRFMGYFTCHAVWSIETGDILCPFIARQQGKERNLKRHEGENKESVEVLKTELAQAMQDSTYAVIAYDGYVTIGKDRLDALLLEGKARLNTKISDIVIAIPYRSAKSKKSFAVFKPKLLKFDFQDIENIMTEFWEGVYEHKKGAAVWDKYLDESL